MNKLDKIISQRLDKILEDKTIFTSSDGTEKTLSSDQKTKIKKAADAGDSVSIRKKGTDIKEYADGEKERYEDIDDTYGTDEIRAIIEKWDNLGFDIPGEAMNEILLNKNWDKDYDVTTFEDADVQKIKQWRSSIVKSVKESMKNKQLKEEGEAAPAEVPSGDPAETGGQNDTVQNLYKIGLGFGGHLAKKKKKMCEAEEQSSSTKKIAKFMENAEKYMAKVNEELKKAIEYENKIIQEAEEEDKKSTEKFSDQVRNELSKMLKDKNLVNAAMEKYSAVMKHVKGQHDAKKIAKSILGTALKAKPKAE